MTASIRKLMATCAVAALAVTIYGCSKATEDRLRGERDEAVVEAAEAQMAKEAAELRAAEAKSAKMMAEQAQMAAEEARAEAERLRMEAEEAARMASGDAAAAEQRAAAAEQRAADAEADADEAREQARLAEEALAMAQTELEVLRAAQMMREQEEQARMDAQTNAGLPGGMARSPAPAVYAMSDQDTLANLLPGGETEFAPLSVALLQQYHGLDRGVRSPDWGAAYVKSISADGMGGFRLVYVLDGEESVAQFEADQYGNVNPCCWVAQASDRNFWLWSFTDSFSEDPDDPAATDRTDGSSYFTYFDILGGNVNGARPHGYDMFFVYGARTMPENLPMGTAAYEGGINASVRYVDDLYGGSESWMRGDLSLEADFDGSTVSGTIDGVASSLGNEGDLVLAPGNSIAISNGMIDAGGFTADWAGNGPMNAARNETVSGFTGTMVGEFYGPAAEEVGGVMGGHRAADGSSPGQILRGFFGGSQPEPEVDQ